MEHEVRPELETEAIAARDGPRPGIAAPAGLAGRSQLLLRMLSLQLLPVCGPPPRLELMTSSRLRACCPLACRKAHPLQVHA